jgi:hypothetical protein
MRACARRGAGCPGLRPRYAALHQALISGMPTQVGKRDEKRQYEGPRQRKLRAVPGLDAGQQAAAVGAVGGAARHPARLRLTNARIEPDWVIARGAAPAGPQAFRPALVAQRRAG